MYDLKPSDVTIFPGRLAADDTYYFYHTYFLLALIESVYLHY